MTTNHRPRERQEAAMSETTEAPRGAWVRDSDTGAWLLYPPGRTGVGKYVGVANLFSWIAFVSAETSEMIEIGRGSNAFHLVERALFARGVHYARLDGQPWPEEAPSPEAAPEARDWSRHNRPAVGFVDPVTGWKHDGGGDWDHPDDPTTWWGDRSGLVVCHVTKPETNPMSNADAPQTLRAAVLCAYEHHRVPLAGLLAEWSAPLPPLPAPGTREELDALAARVAALEATTAATPEPTPTTARERTREDVATAPVVGDVVRTGPTSVYHVTSVLEGRVLVRWFWAGADEWAALVRDPATDVLPMRWPE